MAAVYSVCAYVCAAMCVCALPVFPVLTKMRVAIRELLFLWLSRNHPKVANAARFQNHLMAFMAIRVTGFLHAYRADWRTAAWFLQSPACT